MHKFRIYVCFVPIGDDFSDVNLTITIPATEDMFNGIFVVPNDETFTVTDDDLDEIQESFALVVQLGSDVPDSFTCFQRVVDDTECFGRTGVTEIIILGNDGLLSYIVHPVCSFKMLKDVGLIMSHFICVNVCVMSAPPLSTNSLIHSCYIEERHNFCYRLLR